MIKNEKQYKITNKRLLEIDGAVQKAQQSGKVDEKRQAYINSLLVLKKQMTEEIRHYNDTRSKGISLKRNSSLNRLPDVLIQHKISRRFSQKQFAEILGIKEQQLQRYEADNYKSVSFGRLLEYIEKAKIKIKLTVES